MLTSAVQEFIAIASNKALATYAGELNVVPVSVIEVTSDNILLFDFFMKKTAENIQASPAVALTIWHGPRGIQIKGTAVYLGNGEVYDKATIRMKEQFPTRTLNGVIVITPSTLHDVSVEGRVL